MDPFVLFVDSIRTKNWAVCLTFSRRLCLQEVVWCTHAPSTSGLHQFTFRLHSRLDSHRADSTVWTGKLICSNTGMPVKSDTPDGKVACPWNLFLLSIWETAHSQQRGRGAPFEKNKQTNLERGWTVISFPPVKNDLVTAHRILLVVFCSPHN